ncbi:MAG: mercury(II) reductase [Gemmatimonadota bacterium]
MSTIELQVEGMTCEHCAVSVRKALLAVEGVKEARVSLGMGQAVAETEAGVDGARLAAAVAEAGYRARVRHDGRRRHVLIVGGGSAAFAAAIRSAELGARVTIVERGTIGGTCVNRGCVPSKTLIRAAEIHHRRTHHPFAGLPKGDGRPEARLLQAEKVELVERLRRSKYRDVLAAYPSIEYVEGEARFRGPDAVEVRRGEGERMDLHADRIIIATGASPWVPPIPGIEDVSYWTSTEALQSEQVPARLLVVGGGSVGAELGQMFARLGSRVALIEALPTLLPSEDAELGEALAGYFVEEGIEVYTGTRVTSVSHESGEYRVALMADGDSRTLVGDRLLMATGRRPESASLNLEAAGVEVDRNGFISVDAKLRTNQPHIYAAGDCTPLPQFVYVAARAGTLAAQNALAGEGNGAEEELDLSAMPSVTFTDPQVASVGLTEAGARETGEKAVSRVLLMEQVPRALANRDTRGLIKIVAREDDGRVLGVHLLSPAASEVIQTAVFAVKLGLGTADLAAALFPYLTEVEGLKLAAQTFTREVELLSCCAG